MDIKRVSDARRFDEAKMVKSSIFATPRLFYDLYCLAPGQAQKVHSHATSDKVYLVVTGRARVTLGGEEAELGPDEAVLCPAGIDHGIASAGSEPVTVLVVTTPPPSKAGAS
jgi:mannose-6-phosphate isomerase-like protein (cupin superfamily)